MQDLLEPITACWRSDDMKSQLTTAGLSFVAGLIGVVEVGTTCSLQQIAGSGRLIAQLSRRAGQQSARQQPIVASHPLVGGKVGVAHKGADTKSALLGILIYSEARNR